MRHFLTIFATLALGRVLAIGIDDNNWELIICVVIFATCLGILTYELAKREIK